MTNVRVIALALLALTAAGQQASAATTETFDWSLSAYSPDSFNGGPVTGSGTLTATDNNGVWTVDSITGSFTSTFGHGTYAVTGLGSGGDDEIFPSSSAVVDATGLSFLTTDGGSFLISSLPGFEPGNNYLVQALNLGEGAGNLTLTPTPLPAALPLFAGGLSTLGLLGWRRRNRSVAAA
jgi:hypothetical protein